jgi:hypothetical protein
MNYVKDYTVRERKCPNRRMNAHSWRGLLGNPYVEHLMLMFIIDGGPADPLHGLPPGCKYHNGPAGITHPEVPALMSIAWLEYDCPLLFIILPYRT